MSLIFDSHAHYDDHAFDEDRDRVLPGLALNGIGNVVDVSARLEDISRIIELTESYDFIYGTSGLHPSELEGISGEAETDVRKALEHSKIVAIGEIGLDYHYNDSDKELQKKWFAIQISIAKEMNYPVIVHSRDAAKDTLDIINGENARDAGGVIHCFSYEKEMAREYLNQGFYLGIGGVLTFKNARKLREVVEYMPLERMLLETDCPYLAPEPFRGKRNDSSLLKYVVQVVSDIKKIDKEEIIDVTAANACRMYRIN